MTTELEMLAGVAAPVAECNGVENISHIRDKLAWLAMYAEAVSVIGKASCLYCEKDWKHKHGPPPWAHAKGHAKQKAHGQQKGYDD